MKRRIALGLVLAACLGLVLSLAAQEELQESLKARPLRFVCPPQIWVDYATRNVNLGGWERASTGASMTVECGANEVLSGAMYCEYKAHDTVAMGRLRKDVPEGKNCVAEDNCSFVCR